jgi:hypothetical protein
MNFYSQNLFIYFYFIKFLNVLYLKFEFEVGNLKSIKPITQKKENIDLSSLNKMNIFVFIIFIIIHYIIIINKKSTKLILIKFT